MATCPHGHPRQLCHVCIHEARQKRVEAEYETLSKLTGMTFDELDADLTAPDPRKEGRE